MQWDYGAKRQYRRQVWNTFASRVKRVGGHPGETYALLLPGEDGDEIEVAMQKGFRQEHLCVVDRDPSVIARTVARFPKVLPFSCEMDEAFVRAANIGIPITVANLDLCANISVPLIKALVRIATVWRPTVTAAAAPGQTIDVPYGAVAITVLRGRERPAITDIFTHILSHRDHIERARSSPTLRALRNDTDVARAVMLWSALESGKLPYRVASARVGIYQSIAGHQTLLWVVHDLLGEDVLEWADENEEEEDDDAVLTARVEDA